MNEALHPFIKLTEFLSSSLGPDYETVLTDLTLTEPCIVAIANSYITGRSIGDTLNDSQMSIINSSDIQFRDYISHSTTASATGKTLRSSTFLIRDQGEIVGALCINFDSSRYNDVIERILHLCHPSNFFDYRLTLGDDIFKQANAQAADMAEDPVAATTRHTLDNMGLSTEHISSQDRKRVIAALKSAGIFRIKGAVKTVSRLLGCSQASLYRYISDNN